MKDHLKFLLRLTPRFRARVWTLGKSLVLLLVVAASIRADEMSQSVQSYELNGVIRIGDVTRFCIYDRVGGGHFWLELHDSFRGLEVRGWDPESEILNISLNGIKSDLAFKEDRIVPLKIRRKLTLQEIAENQIHARRQRSIEEMVGMDLAVGYQLSQERRHR